jgi:hypothetical protein
LYTNTPLEIKSLGFGIGLSRKVYFEVGVNYNYAEFNFDQSKDPSFEAGFNTPKHRAKASFGNEKLFKTLVSMLVEDTTHLIYGNLQWLTV